MKSRNIFILLAFYSILGCNDTSNNQIKNAETLSIDAYNETKRLSNLISELEDKISDLESKVDELEDKVSDLEIKTINL